MGNFPVVPFSGEVHKSPSNMNGTNIDSMLVAKAGEFQAIVNNINVSLTTSERVGFARFYLMIQLKKAQLHWKWSKLYEGFISSCSDHF